MQVVKLPSIQFYPGDWLRDDVSACSLAAQGLWLRMMIIAHDSANYGFLEVNGSPMSPEMIARKCGCSLAEFATLMIELDSVGVPSRASNGSIYSRRMVRDGAQRKQLSKKRSEAGKAGMDKRWHDNKVDNKPITSAITNEVTKHNSSSSSSPSSSVLDLYLREERSQTPGITRADELRGDILSGLTETPKFRQIWAELPIKLQTGDRGIWRSWPDIVETVMKKHGIDFDAAEDHILHRVRMFAQSAKGRRADYQWSSKTFFGDAHYDDPPDSWELSPVKKSKKEDDIFGSLRRFKESEVAT